jgi:hypothetical protein
MIRWFRSIATGSAPDDPADPAKGSAPNAIRERLVFFSDAISGPPTGRCCSSTPCC